MKDLLTYLWRLCRWPALTIGIGLAWSLAWWRSGDVNTELEALWLIRLVVAVVAVTATFALDDPSFNVTRACVGARRLLMPARFAAVVLTVAIGLVPAGLAVGDLLTRSTWWGLALEAGSVVAILCGASLLLQRRWQFAEPAQFLVLVVVLFGLYEQLTVGRWPLLAGPGEAWNDAHVRWLVVGGAGMLFLAIQLRDPASRGWRAMFGGPSAGVASRREHASP